MMVPPTSTLKLHQKHTNVLARTGSLVELTRGSLMPRSVDPEPFHLGDQCRTLEPQPGSCSSRPPIIPPAARNVCKSCLNWNSSTSFFPFRVIACGGALITLRRERGCWRHQALVGPLSSVRLSATQPASPLSRYPDRWHWRT
jgi:hypothetical protein